MLMQSCLALKMPQALSNKLVKSLWNQHSRQISTDLYKDKSIKSMEKSNRGWGEGCIIHGENWRQKRSWKESLSNHNNKQQMVNLILKVWSSREFSTTLRGKDTIAICEEKAHKIVEMSEIPALHPDQVASSRTVLMQMNKSMALSWHGRHSFKTIDCLDTGTRNKCRVIDITEMVQEYTPDYTTSLLRLHAYTTCNTTSAFKGNCKVQPIKLLQKKPKYQRSSRSWENPGSFQMNFNFLSLEESLCKMYRTTNIKELMNSFFRCSFQGVVAGTVSSSEEECWPIYSSISKSMPTGAH